MPTGAGFGVGAVVSILHKNLLPRGAVSACFPNDKELGRTNDFVVRSLNVEGLPGTSGAGRATVSSDSVKLHGLPVVFNVAWGSCKIITAAPEDSRVEVFCLILSLFTRVFHVFGRFHGASVLNANQTDRHPLSLLRTMKMIRAMEKFHWKTFQTSNSTLRTSIKMQLRILTLARHLLLILAMMDMIAAQRVTGNMHNMSSHLP
jgi:hypothetical protein